MTLLKTPHEKKRAKPAEWEGDFQPHPGRRMSEAEFVNWVGAKTRAEWVDGEVIIMSPVSREHDKLNRWLSTLIDLYVGAKDLGSTMGPEFMVRLSKSRRRRTPDFMFVSKSRQSIIQKNHCEGAPDLIIELVSPESVQRDWREKYAEYQRGGVKEYWVIDLVTEVVEQNVLGRDGKYAPMQGEKGVFASSVISGLWLKKEWLLGPNRPPVLRVLKDLGVSH